MSELLKNIPPEELKKCRKADMPKWINPMLAKLTHNYFSGEDWIFERKFDGMRVMAYVGSEGTVKLMSRNKKVVNHNFPEVTERLEKLSVKGCILDGEVVTFNRKGVSDFQKLQPLIQSSSREEFNKEKIKVYYYIFDCLYIENYDITRCSLRNRKNILSNKSINWKDPLRFTQHRKEDGLNFYREACSKGWEGLIAKHSEARYVQGRSDKWLKFKCHLQQEFIICGFTEPQGERIGFGALLLGFYRNGNLVYAGEVGTGYDEKTLKELRGKMEKIERKTSPYDEGDPGKKGIHFITPKLVCEVAFTQWTNKDKLRHPRYKGLRTDKNPKNVHKEADSLKADL